MSEKTWLERAISGIEAIPRVAVTTVVEPGRYWRKLKGILPEAVQNMLGGAPAPEDLRQSTKQHEPYGVTFEGEDDKVIIGIPRYAFSKDALQKFATMQTAIDGDGSRLIDHSKKTGLLDTIGDSVPAVESALDKAKELSDKILPEEKDREDFNKLIALREELRAKGGDLRVDLSNPRVPSVVVEIDVAGKSEEQLKKEFSNVLKQVCGVTSEAAVNAEFNRFMRQAKEQGWPSGISQDTPFASAPSTNKTISGAGKSSAFAAPPGGPNSDKKQPDRGVSKDEVDGSLGPQSLVEKASSEEIGAAGRGDKSPEVHAGTEQHKFTSSEVKNAIESAQREFAQNIKTPELTKEPHQSSGAHRAGGSSIKVGGR